MGIFEELYSDYNFNRVDYNHIYVFFYYLFCLVGISIKYSSMKAINIKRFSYIILIVLGFIFGIVSFYKYYESQNYINIFSYTSASIVIIAYAHSFWYRKYRIEKKEG